MCEWELRGKVCVCINCGDVLKHNKSEECRGVCVKPGLGDRVAAAIKATARALRIERWVRETPGCGCKKRREALNKWGRSFWWTKSAK
jgi:hypothetical protein